LLTNVTGLPLLEKAVQVLIGSIQGEGNTPSPEDKLNQIIDKLSDGK